MRTSDIPIRLQDATKKNSANINPNAAADALIDPGFAAMDCFAVPEDKLATKEYVEDIGADASLFQDAWTAFKLS